MKQRAILFFLLFIIFSAKAQEDLYYKRWTSKQADSLKTVLGFTENDSNRMFLNRCLGIHYQEKNRDSSYYFHSQQLALARKLKQKLWQADALDQAGWCLASLKNYSKSLEFFSEAMSILKNRDSENNIWMIQVFSKDKIPKNARLKCLGFCYNDISQLYMNADNIEKGIEALHLGMSVGKEINSSSIIGLISANLCGVYLQIGKLDSALHYGNTGLTHLRISGYDTYKGYVYKLLGKTYLEKEKYLLAKTYLDSSITSSVKSNSFNQLPDAYLAISDLYEKKGQHDSAIIYAYNVITSKYSNAKIIYEAYNALSNLYQKIPKKDSAYHYLQLSKNLGDSLNNAERKLLNAYQNIGFTQQIKAKEKETASLKKENTLRVYGFAAGIAVLTVIAFLSYRNSTIRKKANTLLQNQNEKIEQQKSELVNTLNELKSTQTQLVQQEKLASLGALTAGIAHEIKNPLNFVNNFSELSSELVDEFIQTTDETERQEIGADLKINLQKINEHGKRADSIVKNMLQHSRSGAGEKQLTDINQLCEEYFNLAFHGKRATDAGFNCEMVKNLDKNLPQINCVVQDISRVILNLINNAFDAVREREIEGKKPNYKPSVILTTHQTNNSISISIHDNGKGIPKHIQEKIFEPFFTTKPAGQGTGLGLSLSYDIVKAHGGEMKVESNENDGANFIISLPF